MTLCLTHSHTVGYFLRKSWVGFGPVFIRRPLYITDKALILNIVRNYPQMPQLIGGNEIFVFFLVLNIVF